MDTNYRENKWMVVLEKTNGQYETWARHLEKEIKAMPEGTLELDYAGKEPRYRHVIQGKRIYLGKEKETLIQTLAQKSYDEKVLRVLEQQIARNQKILNAKSLKTVEEVYEQLSPARKELVKPLFLPDDEYANWWRNQPYTTKGFHESDSEEKLYSANGLRVRSRIEGLMADCFDRNRVPFRYEQELSLKGYRYPIHPDFTLLNKHTRQEFIWEHFGMMDQRSYANDAMYRIKVLNNNGYYLGENLLYTFETERNPINMDVVQHMVERFLL